MQYLGVRVAPVLSHIAMRHIRSLSQDRVCRRKVWRAQCVPEFEDATGNPRYSGREVSQSVYSAAHAEEVAHMEQFTLLERAVLERMNSTGTLDRVLAASLLRGFLPTIGNLLGVDTSAGIAAIDGLDQLVVDMADAVQFAERGWAITEVFNVEMLREALRVLRDTQSMERAEVELVKQLNSGERPLWFAVSRVDRIGWDDLELREIARERGRLTEKALAHHVAGSYEASVPMALAQVDGITHDLTERSFFPRRNVEHLLDDTSLLGMDEILGSLQSVYGESMRTSSAHGRLSRHGILHGRELGYDTLENSTKSLVLLGAVVNWAIPRGEKLAEQRAQGWAGTNELDAKGRRRDRRGFEQAIEDLCDVSFGQAKYFEAHGEYAGCVRDLPFVSNADDLMSRPDGLGMSRADDNSAYWSWCGTPSGYVLGVAGRAGVDTELRYAGFGASSSPEAEPERWHDAEEDSPPDWD